MARLTSSRTKRSSQPSTAATGSEKSRSCTTCPVPRPCAHARTCNSTHSHATTSSSHSPDTCPPRHSRKGSRRNVSPNWRRCGPRVRLRPPTRSHVALDEGLGELDRLLSSHGRAEGSLARVPLRPQAPDNWLCEEPP